MTPDELDELVASNVRAIRARKRLRQQDLADELGWPRLTVTSLESGTRRVTFSDVVALCAALEVTLGELVQGAPADLLRTLGIDRRAQ